jgi:hypothetical protein
MSQSAKRRQCPAVGREIKSVECGEKRHSVYACPPTCEHSTFHLANFERYAELESKTFRMMDDWWQNEGQFHRDLPENPLGLPWDDRDKAESFGSSMLAGFKASGGYLECHRDQLNNDQRIMLQAVQQSRVGLYEVRRIYDDRRVELADLLEPERPVFLVIDHELAEEAYRYAPVICLIMDLPFYSRITSRLYVHNSYSSLPSTELLVRTVKHLGGPTDVPNMKRWMIIHFARLNRALDLLNERLWNLKAKKCDLRWVHRVYELHKSEEAVARLLETADGVRVAALTPQEFDAGVCRAWSWTWPCPSHVRAGYAMPLTRYLGRVVLFPDRMELKAMGAVALGQVVDRFESLFGTDVRFLSEDRAAEPAVELARPMDSDPQGLVPGPLEDWVEPLPVQATYVPEIHDHQGAVAPAIESVLESMEFLPDTPMECLKGATPRVAILDPNLKPLVVHLIKQCVWMIDIANRDVDETADISHILQELGVSELILPPPPRRRPRSGEIPESGGLQDFRLLYKGVGPAFGLMGDETLLDAPELNRPQALPLSDIPLSAHEFGVRFVEAQRRFPDSMSLSAEIDGSGCYVTIDLMELVDSEEEFDIWEELDDPLGWLCVSLIGPGCEAPLVDDGAVQFAYSRELEILESRLRATQSVPFEELIRDSPEPHAVKVVAEMMFPAAEGLWVDSRQMNPGQRLRSAAILTTARVLGMALRPDRLDSPEPLFILAP